jgi:hypothetical protein
MWTRHVLSRTDYELLAMNTGIVEKQQWDECQMRKHGRMRWNATLTARRACALNRSGFVPQRHWLTEAAATAASRELNYLNFSR